MRNLKRALSLAMASVMLLGMMVVGTGASYKDVASDKNVEAIEVLQKIGVMVGDDKGNFNPDQNVTRNEMAVVMANLMDYRVASYSGTSPFTDVPSWAEPYVAACYTNGIVAGTSATTYGGDQTVTTAQAALMLMKALGYFQYQSDFEDDWQFATIKQATLIDLFIDVDSGVREAMTRNDVAQLVLNTLESGTVTANDDTIKVDTGDVTVEAGKVQYDYITSGQSYAQAIKDDQTYANNASAGGTGSYIVELGEKLYQGDLKKLDFEHNGVVNGFNAPATQWTYKNAEVGTYAEEADFVFEGGVKSNALYSAVGKTAANNYSWNVYRDGDNTTASDGDPLFGAAQVQNNNTADLKGPGRGTTTYVYLDDTPHGSYSGTATVCIISTYAAEITQVKDDTITLNDSIKALDFDVEGYEEDDVVLYTKYENVAGSGDWTVASVLGVAEYVEGTVNTVKNQDTVVIDDTTYKYNTTVTNDKITIDSYDQTVGFYLDKQGNIALVGDAVESGDYAYVISAKGEADKYGDDDFVINAKLVLEDGSIARVEVDDDNYVTDKATAAANMSASETKFQNQIVTYIVNEDGTYSLTPKTGLSDVNYNVDITQNGVTRINGVSSYGDSNTIYLVCTDADDDEYEAYIGYKSVPDIESASSGTKTKMGVVAKDGVAKFVFVTGATTKMSADDVVFVIGRTGEKVIKTSVGNYYEYKAVVKGETTTIKVKEDSNADTILQGDITSDKQVLVYWGMTENSKGLVTDLETSASDAKLQLETGYFGSYFQGVRRQSSTGLIGFDYYDPADPVDGNDKDYQVWLGADDDATVTYYDYSGHALGETGTIADLRTDTNDMAYVITYDGSIISILIREVDN